MKVFQDSIELETRENFEYINITKKVQDIVERSKVKDGMVFVNSLHNTASVIIQENDPTIHEDTKMIAEELIPFEKDYKHSYEGNVNATAHIKNQFVGNSNLAIPIKNGKLVLGTWQQIFFLELLEPRRREVLVTVIGE